MTGGYRSGDERTPDHHRRRRQHPLDATAARRFRQHRGAAGPRGHADGQRPRLAPPDGGRGRAHRQGPRHRPVRPHRPPTSATALDGADIVIIALSVGGSPACVTTSRSPPATASASRSATASGPAGSPAPCGACRSSPRWPGPWSAGAPTALLINVSNPLTALCRAVGRESDIRVVGLCNELVGLKFSLSLLFDSPMHEVDPVSAGVNHLRWSPSCGSSGADGFAMLRSVLDDPSAHGDEPIWMAPVEGMHWQKVSEGDDVDQGGRGGQQPAQVRAVPAASASCPGASDTHVAEFFPGFVTPSSDFGTGLGRPSLRPPRPSEGQGGRRPRGRRAAGRRRDLAVALGRARGRAASRALATGTERTLPMNLPNQGQVENLPTRPRGGVHRA